MVWLKKLVEHLLPCLPRPLDRGRACHSPGHEHHDDAPDARSIVPRAPGEVAPSVTLSPVAAQAQLQRAFAAAASGTVGGSDPAADVVWVDGDNELLVRPSKMRVFFRAGFVLVGVHVYTEQSGEVEIVVPFAVGAPNDPRGLIVATESAPRGPAEIVEPWSGPLIAASWDALLRVATNVAAAAGVDEDHQPLLPMALVADDNGLSVTPQARHSFDRISR